MNVRKFSTAFAVGAGFLGCTLAGVSAETLRIGVISPLTGVGAPWGIAMAQAGKILATEANAKGGLDVGGQKYQVEIIAYDDQYKAAEAVSAYNRLVKQDDVKYVVMMSSASTMAVKQSIEDDDVVVLSSAVTAKAIDPDTKHLIRLTSIPANYVPPFVAWMKDNVKERSVVIVNPNDETGWEETKIDKASFEQNGFKVLGSELFERGQQEFQPLLTGIIGMNPEIIDIATIPPATAGLLIRQARDLGYKGLFVKTGGPGAKEILAGAGSKEAVEGMISLAFANPETEGYQRIAAEYKKSVGQEPNQAIAQYYDSINVLLHAIEKAGDVNDTTKVLASFSKVLPTQSLEGDELSFGDRQILSTFYVSVMKDGEMVVVGKVK